MESLEFNDILVIIVASLSALIAFVSLYRTRKLVEHNRKDKILRRMTDYVENAEPVIDKLMDEVKGTEKCIKKLNMLIEETQSKGGSEEADIVFEELILLNMNILFQYVEIMGEHRKLSDYNKIPEYKDLESSIAGLRQLSTTLKKSQKGREIFHDIANIAGKE